MIDIKHSPDEFVISSPGGLLPTIHVDRLLRETAPRNRLLARDIARLRIAEGAGLGFDRVWRSLTTLGKEPPHIATDTSFVVTVPGGQGDTVFFKFVRSPQFPDARLAKDLDVLMILAILRNKRNIQASDIANHIQRDVDSAQRTLSRMHDADIVEPSKRTSREQYPSYRLSQKSAVSLRRALAYRTESIDDDDAKLIRHLHRHRSITNEDVRDYLNCDTPTARNRLTRFRKKGWIKFADGSPTRGPNVTYVPTEALDKVKVN